MDILKPDLQIIDGICYRINPGHFSQEYDKGTFQPYEYDGAEYLVEDSEIDDDFTVEVLQNGRMRTSFHVAKIFFPYLIGTKAAMKKRLENETKTVITIPKQGAEGDIIITGSDKKNICSARNRINMLVISARKRQKPTHFLSIPLISSIFQEGFQKFKDNVRRSCPEIKEELFQKSERLHLTLGLLCLCDDVERADAATTLNKCYEEVIKPLLGGFLRVRIQGLECLNDDISAVRVLYGKVAVPKNPTLLQNLADSIHTFFSSKGLLVKEEEQGVLIHATLMNASFYAARENLDDGEGCETFDASKIFELYQDFDFGEDAVSRLDLSIRFSSKPGYYPYTASIMLE